MPAGDGGGHHRLGGDGRAFKLGKVAWTGCDGNVELEESARSAIEFVGFGKRTISVSKVVGRYALLEEWMSLDRGETASKIIDIAMFKHGSH